MNNLHVIDEQNYEEERKYRHMDQRHKKSRKKQKLPETGGSSASESQEPSGLNYLNQLASSENPNRYHRSGNNNRRNEGADQDSSSNSESDESSDTLENRSHSGQYRNSAWKS